MLPLPRGGSLAQCELNSVVASLSSGTVQRSRRPVQPRRALKVIQGSLSARKVERQSPWLAGLHRVASGALVGLGVSVLGLSALTLHWQGEWARSYARLEASKDLEHRLQESAAQLERHHLVRGTRPGQLVPTSIERLIHLPEPEAAPVRDILPFMDGVKVGQIPAGY